MDTTELNLIEFDRRSARSGEESGLRVRLDSKGEFILNRGAFEALGQPEKVVLLYDPYREVIGFRPAADSPKAYRVRPQGKGGALRITGQAFCRKWGIILGCTHRYRGELVGGDLLLRSYPSQSLIATHSRE